MSAEQQKGTTHHGGWEDGGTATPTAWTAANAYGVRPTTSLDESLDGAGM